MNSEPIIKAETEGLRFILRHDGVDYRWYHETGERTAIAGFTVQEAQRRFAFLGPEEARRKRDADLREGSTTPPP